MFENRVLRKIFGFKRDEMKGWRRIHNKELYDLCSSGDHIKTNEIGEACGMYGGRRGAYRVWRVNVMGRNHLEGLGSSRNRVSAWTGLIWLRIGVGGRPL